MTDTLLNKEAGIFCSYLIGKNIPEKQAQLYAEAIKKINISLSVREEKIMQFILSNPKSIGFIDAALALKEWVSKNTQCRVFVPVQRIGTSVEYWHQCRVLVPVKFIDINTECWYQCRVLVPMQGIGTNA